MRVRFGTDSPGSEAVAVADAHASERRVSQSGLWPAALPFLVDAAVALGFVGFPLAALRYGAGPLELGLLGCSPQVAFVSTCLGAASASDRWGRRRAMGAGMALYAVAFAIACAARSVPVLMLSALLIGAGGGLFWPALEAAIADAYGHGPLGRGLLLFNLGWTAGMALGAWCGGALADRAAPLPFAVGLAASVGTGLLLFVWPPRSTAHPTSASSSRETGETIGPATADHYLLLARIANFCAFFGLASLRALFPPLGKALQFSGSLIGQLLAVISVAQAASFFALSRSRRWQYRLGPLLGAECGLLVVLAAMGLASSPAVQALLFAGMGAGCGLAYTASLFYSLDRPVGRGKMGAIHEAVLGAGAMAGPLLGGVLARSAGLRSPFILAAAVMLLGMAVQTRLHRRRRCVREEGTSERAHQTSLP